MLAVYIVLVDGTMPWYLETLYLPGLNNYNSLYSVARCSNVLVVLKPQVVNKHEMQLI